MLFRQAILVSLLAFMLQQRLIWILAFAGMTENAGKVLG